MSRVALMSSLVIDQAGTPAPPGWVLNALAAVDPGLSVKWVANRWAIMLEWRADDARRLMVQRGELTSDATRDVLCMLPSGCSADEARPYFERIVARATTDNDSRVQHLVQDVMAHNTTQHLRNAEQTGDYATEIADTFSPDVRAAAGLDATPKFYQNEGQASRAVQRKRTALPSTVTT